MIDNKMVVATVASQFNGMAGDNVSTVQRIDAKKWECFVEKGKISYFGLARNLIRHLISPNQDDLSYSARTFHFRLTDGLSCQTHSLWL